MIIIKNLKVIYNDNDMSIVSSVCRRSCDRRKFRTAKAAAATQCGCVELIFFSQPQCGCGLKVRSQESCEIAEKPQIKSQELNIRRNSQEFPIFAGIRRIFQFSQEFAGFCNFRRNPQVFISFAGIRRN